MSKHVYNGRYEGEHLNHIAFPLGGIGAGMVCLEGTGGLTHVSLRHKPHIDNEPLMFAAVAIKGDGRKPTIARVLQGPVLERKIFGRPESGNGHIQGAGLPRFARSNFEARFPFATVHLDDPKLPLKATLVGWSPFTPPDADPSSLPVAALEYTLTNTSAQDLELVFSYHATNLMKTQPPPPPPPQTSAETRVERLGENGVALQQAAHAERPHDEGAFAIVVDDPAARGDCGWFRGGWFDALTVLWQTIARGDAPSRPAPTDGGDPSPGGSVYLPLRLRRGESRTVRVLMSWFVPKSDIGVDCGPGKSDYHEPWYAGQFKGISEVAGHWRQNYDDLRAASERFAKCFYDTTLPPEVVEAVAANIAILKTTTVLRQRDGKMWAFEGCGDKAGCCYGTCTHVWNYAQAVPHLFPALERSLRETEFGVGQDDKGHQNFRAALPIRAKAHDFYAAADGQLGGIMKVYREWRVSGDTNWLKRIWPRVRQSLDYCIDTWDPRRTGTLEEPHHNTYDIEFWGPDGMCTSFYLGALAAAVAMGEALGDKDVHRYQELLQKGRAFTESQLYNGEFFIQKVRWKDLSAPSPTEAVKQGSMAGKYSTEALALLEAEGPKYQYGEGCLSDGVLGAWLAEVCGVGQERVLDPAKLRSHIAAVFKHNFKPDLSEHANPQRPGYALGEEGGLLLCSWPRGGKLALPFPYSDEVWTGIEWHVATHLMRFGMLDEALKLVRAARDRYDGRVRDPFDEYECGHWYARAMSSYAMLQGLTGVRYDAVEKVLHVAPTIKGDFRSFLCTANGYGTAGVKGGKPFLEVKHGSIPVERTVYKTLD